MAAEASLVVDGIEAGVARLEDASGRTFEVPATWLPLESRPGDVLRVVAFGSGERRLVQLGRDEDERRRRLDSAREVLNRLKADDDGGDIEL